MARPERLTGGCATLSSLCSSICRLALPTSVRTPDRAIETNVAADEITAETTRLLNELKRCQYVDPYVKCQTLF